MIRTVIEFKVRIEYEAEHKNRVYRENKQSLLQNAIEHCRQENMLDCNYDECTNWVEIISSRVVTSSVIPEGIESEKP